MEMRRRISLALIINCHCERERGNLSVSACPLRLPRRYAPRNDMVVGAMLIEYYYTK